MTGQSKPTPPERGGRTSSVRPEQRKQVQRDQARERNGRRHKRRRKGSRLAFRIILAVLFLGAVGCVALTVLCKAETIEVVGSGRYDTALVLEASGVAEGDSLLMMNGANISAKVSSSLPYVQKIVLHRTLPSKVVLEVVEAVPARAYVLPDGAVLCDDQGRVLEYLDAPPDGLPLVLGADIGRGNAGGALVWNHDEQKKRLEQIDQMLRLAELGDITRYDMRDEISLKLIYKNAVVLDFGSQSNFEYKIRFAKEYLDHYFVEGQTGTLNLTLVSGDNRKVYFREHGLETILADTGDTPPSPAEDDSAESIPEPPPSSAPDEPSPSGP